MSDPVSLVDNLVSNDKVLLKQSEEGTATDSLKRALAEWVAFKQKSSDAPVRIRPAYDWLGMELAQRIVDELQEFLDLQEKEEPVHRKNQVGLLRSLSQRFQILPSSLMVQNVRREGGNPVAGGGFADIWRGTLQGKTVCLKVLRIVVEQDVTVRDTIRKEFCREALIWRQLRHPNILPLLGVNISLFYPSFCLVSPWMENKDIIAYLKQNPDHSLRTALSEVAAGPRYMHSVVPPLVHGDIRGANILVTDDRRCCLADFGLSVITTSSQAWTMTTSSSSASKGTMRWLAPEYITSEIPNHPSRDIYAFGCTILEMFTQKPPFSDRKNEAAVLLHLMGGGRPDRPQDDRYSDAIWKLTTQCWAENVQARPSAHQVYDALNGSIHVTSNSSILFKLGCDYEQQKEYDRARDTFEQIVLVDPVHTQALLRLGRLYHQDETSFQNQDLAILYVTQSLETDSSNAQTWYLLGQAYRAGQKYNKAYEAYQQAVYRDGKNPAFWCSIGILYIQIDQTRDALDAYSRAIRIHPYIPELWLNLGSLYETNEQVPDAIDAYNRASELDPENRDISSRIRLLRVAQETGGRLPVPLAPQNIDPIVYATAVLPPLAWVHTPALLELPNQPAVLPDLTVYPVLSGLLDQQRLLPNSNSGTARSPPPPTPQLKSSATRPSPPVTIADSSHGLLAHPLAPTQVNGPVRDDGNHVQQNFHEVSPDVYPSLGDHLSLLPPSQHPHLSLPPKPAATEPMSDGSFPWESFFSPNPLPAPYLTSQEPTLDRIREQGNTQPRSTPAPSPPGSENPYYAFRSRPLPPSFVLQPPPVFSPSTSQTSLRSLQHLTRRTSSPSLAFLSTVSSPIPSPPITFDSDMAERFPSTPSPPPPPPLSQGIPSQPLDSPPPPIHVHFPGNPYSSPPLPTSKERPSRSPYDAIRERSNGHFVSTPVPPMIPSPVHFPSLSSPFVPPSPPFELPLPPWGFPPSTIQAHAGSSQHLAPRASSPFVPPSSPFVPSSSPFVPPSSPFEPRWSFPPPTVQAHVGSSQHFAPRASSPFVPPSSPFVPSSSPFVPSSSSPFVPPSSPFEPRWSFPPLTVQAHVPRASSLLALPSALPGPPAPPASGSAVASAVASGQRYDLSPTVYPPLLKPNSKTESERQPNTQERDAGSTSSNNSGASSPPMTMKRSRSRTPDRQTKRSRFRKKSRGAPSLTQMTPPVPFENADTLSHSFDHSPLSDLFQTFNLPIGSPRSIRSSQSPTSSTRANAPDSPGLDLPDLQNPLIPRGSSVFARNPKP